MEEVNKCWLEDELFKFKSGTRWNIATWNSLEVQELEPRPTRHTDDWDGPSNQVERTYIIYIIDIMLVPK